MLVSFDIDGTMEFGHPPGPVTVALVRTLLDGGHIVGSASDRTRSDQASLWATNGIEPAFVGGKHHLPEVRARFAAERRVHVGDTDVDRHYARLAGFEFVRVDALTLDVLGTLDGAERGRAFRETGIPSTVAVVATAERELSSSIEDVAGRLVEDGYAIVEGVLSRDEATAIGAELRRLLDDVPTGRNFFEGFSTRRLYAVFGKTRVLDPLALDPLVLGALEHVLGPHFQLSGPTGIEIGPGEQEQVLHRDEDIYPVPRPHPQLVTNVMWAFDGFTRANGATRLVPGSHHLIEQPGPDAPMRYAEMPAGSLMLYVGSLWHGGGANTTDRSRLGVAIEYVAAWLRPQETQLLAVPPDVARTLPKRLRELLGYNVYPPFLGYVDGRHPDRVLGIDADS